MAQAEGLNFFVVKLTRAVRDAEQLTGVQAMHSCCHNALTVSQT